MYILSPSELHLTPITPPQKCSSHSSPLLDRPEQLSVSSTSCKKSCSTTSNIKSPPPSSSIPEQSSSSSASPYMISPPSIPEESSSTYVYQSLPPSPFIHHKGLHSAYRLKYRSLNAIPCHSSRTTTTLSTTSIPQLSESKSEKNNSTTSLKHSSVSYKGFLSPIPPSPSSPTLPINTSIDLLEKSKSKDNLASSIST